MNRNKAYVVFEPINHVMKVIAAAKRRGFHVIVFRTMPLTTIPPYAAATACIDVDVVIDSWLDQGLLAAVNDVCENHEVVGSYAAAEATLYFESLFRAHHGLAGLSPERVEFILDKQRVRTFLKQQGLSRLTTMSQQQALQLTAWPAGAVYYFKPVNGAGSALVRRCECLEDLQAAIANWQLKPEITLDWLRQYIEGSNSFFLDQAAEGVLLSVEGFAVDGAYYPIGISSRTLLHRDNTVELGLCFPYRHPHSAAIIQKVRAIHTALGVNNGPTHTEVMFTPDGAVELVELNIRFVGGDGVLAINIALGVTIEDDIVRVTCGQKPLVRSLPERTGVAAFQLVMPPIDLKVLDTVEFPAELVEFHRISFPPGTALHSTLFQTDTIGSYVVGGDSYEQLLERANHVRENIRVNGVRLGRNVNNVVDIY
jgi:biotin carboxylase